MVKAEKPIVTETGVYTYIDFGHGLKVRINDDSGSVQLKMSLMGTTDTIYTDKSELEYLVKVIQEVAK